MFFSRKKTETPKIQDFGDFRSPAQVPIQGFGRKSPNMVKILDFGGLGYFRQKNFSVAKLCLNLPK